MVTAHVDVSVHDASEAAADERADPVDPDVGEVAAGHGGAEGASRVHGPAREGPGYERMLAPTMKPMAMGAMVPREPFLGSAAVAYTV